MKQTAEIRITTVTSYPVSKPVCIISRMPLGKIATGRSAKEMAENTSITPKAFIVMRAFVACLTAHAHDCNTNEIEMVDRAIVLTTNGVVDSCERM